MYYCWNSQTILRSCISPVTNLRVLQAQQVSTLCEHIHLRASNPTAFCDLCEHFTDDQPPPSKPPADVTSGDDVISLADERRSSVEWKFSELDVSADRQLNRRELRTFRQLVGKLVRPPTCARTFSVRCDTDRDRKLSREEWNTCFNINGVDDDASLGDGWHDALLRTYQRTVLLQYKIDVLILHYWWAQFLICAQVSRAPLNKTWTFII